MFQCKLQSLNQHPTVLHQLSLNILSFWAQRIKEDEFPAILCHNTYSLIFNQETSDITHNSSHHKTQTQNACQLTLPKFCAFQFYEATYKYQKILPTQIQIL